MQETDPLPLFVGGGEKIDYWKLLLLILINLMRKQRG
jgi:hypothetical protein